MAVLCKRSDGGFGRTFQGLLAVVALLYLAACGGGSSGGSGTGASGGTGDITLLSITFPKEVSLEKSFVNPPKQAPLSQQIVFTFSGPIKEQISSSAISIYALPGLYYEGPLLFLNQSKNIIEAKGTFEVLSNVVVFTPLLPKKAMNLTLNAGIDEVPGLLPDTTYHVHVPVGTSGSIPNLVGIDPKAINPTTFKTGSIPQFYFENFLLEPPEVTETDPEDGRSDFPVNTLSVMDGSAPHGGIRIAFDQPLNPDNDNLLGSDSDGDGFPEPNLFLRFSDPLLFAAPYHHKGILRLDRLDPGNQEAIDTFKGTFYEGVGVALSDLAMSRTGILTGLSKGVLYTIDYRSSEPMIPLKVMADTGRTSLKGLALSSAGKFYSVDLDSGELVSVDQGTGETEAVGYLSGGDTARDLAYRHDDTLYLLRVEGIGTLYPLSYLETVEPESGDTQPFLKDLPGAFTSMSFISKDTLCLFESGGRSLWTLNLDTYALSEVGPLFGTWNIQQLDLATLFYEMDTDPTIVDQHAQGCTLSLPPKGMLPFGESMEIMIRNRLENIRGWSRSQEEDGPPALASRCVSVFTTFDPGTELTDRFLELFEDNIYESTDVELALAPASWNHQDVDGEPPIRSRLVASLGLGGSGELGDFVPLGIFPLVLIDTDYQPLPLYDGSTPNVVQPTVVRNGRFNFRDIKVPLGVTVHARGSNPLVFTATGDVEIGGTIDVSGERGMSEDAFDSGFIPVPGGPPGAGGGYGGKSQPPVPENFQSISQLLSAPTGEVGWGPGNKHQIGGRGGDTGAWPGVPPKGTAEHKKSRGAGGGGGTMLQTGFPGKDGRGKYVPDGKGGKIKKIPPEGGNPGDLVFMDENPDNDYFGLNGEISELIGGQGGGGAGCRWDGYIDGAAKNLTPPGMPMCMWDAKGGGGGGGSGSFAITALGTIRVTETGKILARGGGGGMGEQVGTGNWGGGAGGGSGGAIILHSGKAIILEESSSPDPDAVGAVIDVSGGIFGDCKEEVGIGAGPPYPTCPEDGSKPKPQYCSLSDSDGGHGGFGLIQLMVHDPDQNISPPPGQIASAKIKVGADIFWADPNDLTKEGYPKYIREFLTFESDPQAYPKTYLWGFDETLVVDASPVVDPHLTVANISPISYGVSKWINLLGASLRPPLASGTPTPFFLPFRGTDPLTGIVQTESGYVYNWWKTNPDGTPWNDLEITAPDLAISNFIPEENQVVITFQGAHAAAPGLSIAGDDRSGWTPDITDLAGYQFIRFKIALNVSISNNLTTENPRPQVNNFRIRVQY